MNEEKQDFDAKLLMIEELARMSIDEHSIDMLRNRLEAIAVTARLLRLRLQVLDVSLGPSPHEPEPGKQGPRGDE